MENNSFTNGMDMMLGNSPEAIAAYFGKAALWLPTLAVYMRKGGYIVVTFGPKEKNNMEMEANGYVLYDRSGTLLHAKGVQPVAMNDSFLQEKTSIAAIAEVYGEPHADIGSGTPIFAYLSDHGSMYCVRLLDDEYCIVQERPLVQD